MINNYALEGIKDKKDDGHPKPTGHFYLTRDVGRKVAAETICTHFAKCGDAGQAFLDENYDKAFDYYDVNKEGKLDAVGMAA